MKQVLPYNGHKPDLHETVFVAPGAIVVGDVRMGEGSAVWYNTVLRADVNSIRIGRFTNIQDCSVIHEDSGRNTGEANGTPTILGDYVTVGHNAVLHGCTIEDHCLVGMGAIVMDGTVVGRGSIIGAGALVTKGQNIPPFSLVLGSPAKVVRSLDESIIEKNHEMAIHYHHLAQAHGESIKE